MVESRLLTESTSFGETADEWAKTKGLLDEDGNVTTGFPEIIGMPDGSTDLGAFNIGIIQNNRKIKQALQDLETATSTRLQTTNNLSDVPNKTVARTNLGLGSAATWNTGSSGATIPLLNVANTWSAKQNFSSQLSATARADIVNAPGSSCVIAFTSDGQWRWLIGKDGAAESGSNAGADFSINRYDDTGAFINTVFKITRSTGVLHLAAPLPVASGGTGSNTLAGLKTTLGLENVNNTSDANKPISTATQTALDGKLDKIGGTVSGALYATGIINSTSEVRVNNNDSTNMIQLRSDGGIEICRSTGPYLDFKTSTAQDYLARIQYDSTNSRLTTQTLNGVVATTTSGVNAGTFITTNGSNAVFTIQSGGMSSAANGFVVVDLANESGVPFATVRGLQETNGAGTLEIFATAAGSRAVDRRSSVATFNTSAITCNVPINGRAYPRNGAGGNINFNWNGQSGQPEWLWGGNNGTDMYVYNPNNFSVNYATTCGTANQANLVTRSVTGTGLATLVSATMADNDSFRIMVGGTASNSGYVEIATADDGNEPIYVRQYTGPFSSIARTAALLDNNGNTSFPGGLSAGNITANSQFYTNGWYRSWADGGLFWENRGRGLTVADNGATFGQVNITGVGANGWHGYSIYNYASFMGNSDTVGIHSQQRGTWLVSWDTASNAVFPANITAFSDERLKENKRPINNVTLRRRGMAKAAIMYERDGKTRIGFGAQTLEQTVPEVVFTADDHVNTKCVNYMDTISILAVDANNLDDRITQLEKERDELKETVAILSDRLARAGF